jgi:hypothetical protein
MVEREDLWLLEELPNEESSELFALPEIRQQLVRGRADDDVGIRALLERPEALSTAWWHKASEGKRRPKSTKRHSRDLRAA